MSAAASARPSQGKSWLHRSLSIVTDVRTGAGATALPLAGNVAHCFALAVAIAREHWKLTDVDAEVEAA
jgi:hypothetical protein